MHVCATVGDPDTYGGHDDELGNSCYSVACGWEDTTPSEYWGGCTDDLTAGTLCCQTDGCTAGAVPQNLGPDMVGCGASVTFADRATLCSSGWRTCTAAEWRSHVAGSGTAPSAHYWVDDQLYYENSGGPGDCAVTDDPLFPNVNTNCVNNDTPMHVCALIGPISGFNNHDDAFGNACNWIGCGWEVNTPQEYWGGCTENQTAGTLCCR
jgi:hypothetical protein